MLFILYIFIQYFTLNIYYGNGQVIEINALGFVKKFQPHIINSLIYDFNEYSGKENLGVRVKLNYLTPANSTSESRDYASMIDHLLRRNSTKYDIYFYDNIYINKFGKDFINLEGLLPEEHISNFNSSILKDICYFNNKLVSLPVMVDYSILYSNKDLLDKYNREVPKTWNDLLNISVEIKNEEKNNTDLLIYNGLFPDDELGTCSLYEYLYSFRDSIDSNSLPLNSNNAVEALKLLKRIKDKTSPNAFRSDSSYYMPYLNSGNALFFKFWYAPNTNPVYIKSILPGRIEGLSGSTTGGYNVAIRNNIDDTRRDASLKVVKYITSIEVQKKMMIEKKLCSAIRKLYDDENVCEVMDCRLFKNIQPIIRPYHKYEKDYDYYSERFRKYIYEFLYNSDGDCNNCFAENVLKKVNDITKIYYLTLDTRDSYIGLFFFITVIIISSIMLYFLTYINKVEYMPFFSFLPNIFWIFVTLGSIIVLSASFANFGVITIRKCHIKLLFVNIGFTLNVIPYLYKLIIIFPGQNDIKKWISKHKYRFISIFLSIDITLNFFASLTPYYDVQKYVFDDGENYNACKINQRIGIFVFLLFIIYKAIIIFAILSYIFIEWNMKSIHYEIRFLVFSMYSNVFSVILLIIMNHITVKNYVIYYSFNNIIFIFFSTTNYFCLYGYRVIIIFFNKKEKNSLYKRKYTLIHSSTKKSTKDKKNNDDEDDDESYSNIDKSNAVSYYYSSYDDNDLDKSTCNSIDVANSSQIFE